MPKTIDFVDMTIDAIDVEKKLIQTCLQHGVSQQLIEKYKTAVINSWDKTIQHKFPEKFTDAKGQLCQVNMSNALHEIKKLLG